jgi:hypothetical protein
MRPSWGKVTKKSKKRVKELLSSDLLRLTYAHGFSTVTELISSYRRLRVFERAQKKLAKLHDPSLEMIGDVINGQGNGWDENIRVRGGGAMSVQNPIEMFDDIV